MPLLSTGELVASARTAGRGLAAFNVITLEHAEAIVAGAERAGQPAVLQVSENAVRFHHDRPGPLFAALCVLARESSAPLSLHLDHVTEDALFRLTGEVGASSAMIDASKLDYAGNVAATRAAADWGRGEGLFVEAELGEVGGKDGAHAPGVRTDPDEAVRFVEATGVDALAVAVGSSHAMVERTSVLDLDLIAELRDRVPVPLVLHGSSGVADVDLSRAVEAGITKVNIGTILNVSFTGAIREALAAGDAVDPRTFLRPAREAVAETVARLLLVVS